MRLATLDDGTRDGALVVVSKTGDVYAHAREIAPTLQAALDAWDRDETALRELATRLDKGEAPCHPLAQARFKAPLPRAYEWIDGSAYINHILLVRKARGADLPQTLESDPLVYQGGSSVLLGPTDDIELPNPEWGLDFESELCVVLGDTPRGVQKADAARYVRLFMLANDLTFRNLIPSELQKGFGFFNSKPSTSFSPFAITVDELGTAFRDGRVHLRLRSTYNGQLVGDPEAGPEMHFSFFELVAHITKSRGFCAGTLLGSGTVSNRDQARGVSCLAERRMIETLESGKPKTPWMKAGDTIEIEMLDESGRSLFGRISQKVVAV